MKKPLAMMALLGALAGGPAWGQALPSGGPADSAEDASPAAGFEPTPVDQLKAPTMDLPDDPVEPYLLTKNNGPFMVLAKTFQGPDSQKLALALVKELRNEYNLPAYILRNKDRPGGSNIRGVPPQADPHVVQANTNVPEKVRTYDQAAVLVGDEKTEKAASALLHKVKKIDPRCLQNVSTIFHWRKGLSNAIRTTNPYVAAQDLYPAKKDRLIVQMNSGEESIAYCPGRYTLQVAEFAGRSTLNEKDPTFQGNWNLLKSPLRTAASDAEKMANTLRKDKDVAQLGQPVYVYHDRTSSKVFVGSFEAPDDPRAGAMRDALVKLAVPLMQPGKRAKTLDTMIAPASMLTDLEPIKQNFRK
ncbi:hypothetical protein [Planctomyces sp. SH-PL62]|uniref:hypothetical protein n=1 Tax=Planctomyces sp. SH-PL62 TaxID=1636152 RepID=UPI00078D8F09|nr:hypothetical protein [Planctomyces sp. SH-PL62]AMV39784.1 hypothetical protein VT85_20290 [Planctomyces sp. SH-PL62]